MHFSGRAAHHAYVDQINKVRFLGHGRYGMKVGVNLVQKYSRHGEDASSRQGSELNMTDIYSR